MGKPLEDYDKKRDFTRTPEPRGKRPKGRGKAPVFVVHRHDARALHWDLRLELDGVLKSWAVPKGFSYDPTEKRLAVRTEDHPLEYEHFDGVIPAGQYGAGSMTIWDHGRFEVLKEPWDAALARGELKLLLWGRRLRGEWHMVLTRKEEGHWLLFKSRDRYAGEDRDSFPGVDLSAAAIRSTPRSLKPPEPGSEAAPFSDPEWLFEMEFAGRRVLAEKRGEDVRLRGLKQPPAAVVTALGRMRCEAALVDGVLVALDEHQRPSPALVEERLASGSDEGVAYYAFDLLHFDEFDLRPLPLRDRKTALRAVLAAEAPLFYVDHVTGDGESLARAAADAGLPSIVAKRADAPWKGGTAKSWKRIQVESVPGAAKHDVAEALARSKKNLRPSARVKLSNLEKVYWPAEGYTKGDLIAYYDKVADVLLPYLRDRPLHMYRFPDGIEGKSFYQRNVGELAPDWVETVDVESGSHAEPVLSVVCNDRDTLLWLANMGSIDLHPWLSRRGSFDEPDWVVLDLDAKESPFTDVITIARVAGRILREAGLRALLKTSGATGMHVYIPLKPGYTYDHARMFCEAVARLVCRELPQIATVERMPSKRGGRVYVDFGQNRRSQTVVPPYVPRPRPGATVSTPLAWEELDDDELRPSRFTILTVPPRLEALGDLFRPALDDHQDLIAAIEAIQSRMGG